MISGIYQHSSGLLESKVRVFPMIHKSFMTSPELSLAGGEGPLPDGEWQCARLFCLVP